MGVVAFSLYALLVIITALRHEPWADEAQSWLLARDASLWQLWTGLLHYEGTPGLWQSTLHVLQLVGIPYTGLNIISGLLGMAGVAVLVWRAPFPRGVRYALPFTYYIFYQYSVVARSYALLPVLLFSCAAIFANWEKRLWLFTTILCLMAAVSIHGLALSLAIWIGALVHRGKPVSRRVRGPAGAYAGVAILTMLSAWPAKDVTFVRHLNFSLSHLLVASRDTFSEAFTGEWLSSLAAVAISVPFLWRTRALPFFALAAGMLCIVNGVVYAQVWHRGILFLAWLFAMWIGANTAKLTTLAAAALVAVVAIQGYWAVATVWSDWTKPYSGAKEAARFIRAHHMEDRRIFAVGYACTAVQPYFPANLFANLHEGKGPAFWDWSARNNSLAELNRLQILSPEYVLVGYTGLAEKMIWNDQVRRSGYSLLRHFDGNLLWRGDILEPNAFDLYRRQ